MRNATRREKEAVLSADIPCKSHPFNDYKNGALRSRAAISTNWQLATQTLNDHIDSVSSSFSDLSVTFTGKKKTKVSAWTSISWYLSIAMKRAETVFVSLHLCHTIRPRVVELWSFLFLMNSQPALFRTLSWLFWEGYGIEIAFRQMRLRFRFRFKFPVF